MKWDENKAIISLKKSSLYSSFSGDGSNEIEGYHCDHILSVVIQISNAKWFLALPTST